MWRILATFVGPGKDRTSEFLNATANPQFIIRITTYGIETLIGDAFIVSMLLSSRLT